MLGVRSIRRWECWDLIKTAESLPRVWHQHGTNRILWLMWRHVTRDIETTGHVGPGTLQQQMILLKRTFKQPLYINWHLRVAGHQGNITILVASSSCICTNVPAIMTPWFAITVKQRVFNIFAVIHGTVPGLAWQPDMFCFTFQQWLSLKVQAHKGKLLPSNTLNKQVE